MSQKISRNPKQLEPALLRLYKRTVYICIAKPDVVDLVRHIEFQEDQLMAMEIMLQNAKAELRGNKPIPNAALPYDKNGRQ